jgi:(E)-4-hydroxy-3-methylbut-2-enyl-diphosphate synthase
MISTTANESSPATSTVGNRQDAYCASPYVYQRRRTRVVMVGNVGVGGDNPIRVQSMTTPSTLDIDATVAQAERLVAVGCEIVRITAPTVKEARNLGEIKRRLRLKGIDVPLVADIHFSPDAAIEAANHVEKVRVNPGNYADTRKFAVRSYSDAEYAAELARIEERFAPLVLKCKANQISMRIGTNHGSLSDRIMNRFGDTPEGMVESALEFVQICEKYGYRDVILSMKASNVKVMIVAYRLLAARMATLGMTYPFHLGVTEAGNGVDGRIKSVIGIGSLLADGIGDTIRVSLTEEPEEEVPVAFAIANHFTPRDQPSLPLGEAAGRVVVGTPAPLPPWDPFHYERRKSAAVRVGPVVIGNGNTLAVVARVGEDGEARVLRWASPGARRLRRPDVVEWPVPSADALAGLGRLRERLGRATSLALLLPGDDQSRPPLGFLASGADADLLRGALPFADAVLFRQPSLTASVSLAAAARTAGKSLWLAVELSVPKSGEPSDLAAIDAQVQELLAIADACRRAGPVDLVLSATSAGPEELIVAQRLLAARLAARLAAISDETPLFLRSFPSEDRLIAAALPIGSLLADGIGDAVQVGATGAGQFDVELSLDVLQGAGTRMSKTDYVACPSCGRTLFDLQSTTERIKAKTSHLVGVKIAIMGCVVNGPGEMADADFGYVGGAPGQVNLYVGKTCVERAVPAEVADEKLVELIKAHGRWKEPEVDEEAP